MQCGAKKVELEDSTFHFERCFSLAVDKFIIERASTSVQIPSHCQQSPPVPQAPLLRPALCSRVYGPIVGGGVVPFEFERAPKSGFPVDFIVNSNSNQYKLIWRRSQCCG